MRIDVDEHISVWSRLRAPSLVVAAVAMVVAWIVFNPLTLISNEVDEVPVVRETAQIRLSDLSESFDAEGSLVFADAATIVHPVAGTITGIADPGLEVLTATVLYSVDNVPTVSLPGTVPAWRSMSIDAVGADVAQLEVALVELGYDSFGLLTVDDTYTSYTADLVMLWQADLGVEETGIVELGTVVFTDGPSEVGAVFGEVGQTPPPTGVLTVRSIERVVVFTVDQWPGLDVADVVIGRFPDRTEFEVVLLQVDSDGAGTWTLTGELAASDLPIGGAEEVPVDISWSVDLGSDLLVAPASSIKRLDSQSYVVEVVLGDIAGSTVFVPVELGRQSGSLVEVRGDVAEGTTVVSP